jgi:hypothetical protein
VVECDPGPGKEKLVQAGLSRGTNYPGKLTILINQFIGRGNFDRRPQRSCNRTAVCVQAMNALNDFALGFRRPQLVMGVDAPDDQNTPFQFNLASNLRNQVAVARINLARFQRTAESPGQSPSRRGNNIVKSCGTSGKFIRW